MEQFDIDGTLDGDSLKVKRITIQYIDEWAKAAQKMFKPWSGLEPLRTVGEHSAHTVVTHGGIEKGICSVSICLRDDRSNQVLADHPDLLAILRQRAEEIDGEVKAKVKHLREVAADVQGACEAGLLAVADEKARLDAKEGAERAMERVMEIFHHHDEQHDDLRQTLRRVAKAGDKRIDEVWRALEKLGVERPALVEAEDEEEA